MILNYYLMVIPKIIHQTSKSKNHKFLNFSDNWKKINKGWEYRFYDDYDVENFFVLHENNINNDFSKLQNFLSECSIIEKIDIFRYLLMYYIGGIYCDIDTNCFKNFDNVCKNQDCILGIESYITHEKKNKLNYKFNYTLGNAILISKKKHPFFKKLILNIINKKYITNIHSEYSEYVVQTTGPGVLTKTIQDQIYSPITNNWNIRNFNYENNTIKIMEQIFFYPPTNPPIYNFFPFNINIHSNHVCEGSWKKYKNNKFSTMDFVPYPFMWMYKYRFDYMVSILSMMPILQTANILWYQYKLQSILMIMTFLSAFLYHTNEYIGGKRYEILHKFDNVMAYNNIPLIYVMKIFKNNQQTLNLFTIISTLTTCCFQSILYSNTLLEIIQIAPFIYLVSEYFYEYFILSILTSIFFILGSQEFDYFSARKYHSLWHLFGSLLIYNITNKIIN